MSSRSSRSFCFIFFRMVRSPIVPVAPSQTPFLPSPGTPLPAAIGYHATDSTAYWPTARLVPPPIHVTRQCVGGSL